MADSSQQGRNPAPGILPENTFKILVATDIHLGYDETNEETGRDSFNTFEEILMLAHSRQVDFILLAGDLFHKAQPSASTLNKCIQLLRFYTMGKKKIQFVVTDTATGEQIRPGESANDSATVAPLNYEDDFIKISYPVFSIHGNHDDIVNSLSAIDILSSSGLVNYFGRWDNLMEINLKPIIFRKGLTSIALYGLSHIPDRRLNNLFQCDKVSVSFPGELAELNQDYFSILTLHQNRAERGRNNNISVDMLPKFMNMVIWGHEHDCRITPELYENTYVVQPGSSVATSLCEGEAMDKKVGILQVCYNPLLKIKEKHQFLLSPVSLKTVRPFIFKAIDLPDYQQQLIAKPDKVAEKVENLISAIVVEMLKESKGRFTRHPRQPKKPLIRLRVNYDNVDHLINTRRFSQRFSSVIANSDDVLLFKKIIHRTKTEAPYVDAELLKEARNNDDILSSHVEDVVDEYFSKLTDEKAMLKMFNYRCLSDTVRLIVNKEDQVGAEKILRTQIKAAREYLIANNAQEKDEMKELLLRFRDLKSAEIHEQHYQDSMAAKKDPTANYGKVVQAPTLKMPKTDRSVSPPRQRAVVIDDDDDDMSFGDTKKKKKKMVAPPPKQANTSLFKKTYDSSPEEISADDVAELSMRAPAKRQTAAQAGAQSKRGRGARGAATTAAASTTSTRGRGRPKATDSSASTSSGKGRAKKDPKPASLSIAEQLSQTRSRRVKTSAGAAATSTQASNDYSFVIPSSSDDDSNVS